MNLMSGPESQPMKPHYQHWAEEDTKEMAKGWIDYNC